MQHFSNKRHFKADNAVNRADLKGINSGKFDSTSDHENG